MFSNKVADLQDRLKNLIIKYPEIGHHEFAHVLLRDNATLLRTPEPLEHSNKFSFLYESYLDLLLRAVIFDIKSEKGIGPRLEAHSSELCLTGFEGRYGSAAKKMVSMYPLSEQIVTDLILEILIRDQKQLEKSVKQFHDTIENDHELKSVLNTTINRDIFLLALKKFRFFNDYSLRVVDNQNNHSRWCIYEYASFLSPLYSELDTINALAPDSNLLVSRLMLVDLTSIGSRWEAAELLPSTKMKEIFGFKDSVDNFSKVTNTVDATTKWDEIHLKSKVKDEIEGLCELFLNRKINQLSFFFYGTSGVGKTLLANAIASKLGLKILKVSFSGRERDYAAVIRYLLVQARTQNFVLHFEECQSLIQHNYSRRTEGYLKDLFETFGGVVIFTANGGADDAFLRRCSYFQEMGIEDAEVRLKIIQQEVKKFSDKNDVKIELTPEQYQHLSSFYLAAGHINWTLTLAFSRANDKRLDYESILNAFKSRLHTQIGSMTDNEKIETANEELPLEFNSEMNGQIHKFLTYSETVLRNEKPFKGFPDGSTILLSGPSGTGKTALSKVLASKLRMKFKKVSAANLLGMYVGQSEKQIRSLFNEINERKSLVLIDEAESLFRSRDLADKSWELSIAGELLRCVEDCRGVVAVATNHPQLFDKAFERRFLFQLKFELPDAKTRYKIFSNYNHVFKRSDVELLVAAETFVISGSQIKNMAIRYHMQELSTHSDFVEALRMCHEESWEQKQKVIGLA